MPNHEQSANGKATSDRERPAQDRPAAGGALDFDDGGDMVHPRGKVTGAGRTWDERNPSDAGDLGAPNVGMSDRNGPSDPDARRNPRDRNE